HIIQKQRKIDIQDENIQRVLSIKPPSISAHHSEFFQTIQNPPNEHLLISENILETVELFVKDMEKGYSNEECRCEILEKHLKNVIGPMEKVENSDKTKSDRVVTILVQSFIAFALVVLAEVKNEIGTGFCDPTIQIAGPWLCVLGAVYLEKEIVNPFTDFIPLMQFYNNSYYKKIARLLEALHLASIHGFGNNISFNYNDLFMEDCTEFVWRATTETESPIIIKYTQTYNVNAHKICAEKQLAPQILFASNKIIDGWWIIIMKSVEELLLYHAQLTDENYLIVMQDIKQAIKLLHGNELVFANLCSTNILVYKIEMKTRAMLFGFDWCGEHTIGRYPFLISSTVKSFK
ncbi:698_t:CDS:2, partial [Racocetra persica]